MFLLAFILAIAAVVIFVIAAWRKPPLLVPTGLALATAAWVIQMVLTHGTRVTVH